MLFNPLLLIHKPLGKIENMRKLFLLILVNTLIYQIGTSQSPINENDSIAIELRVKKLDSLLNETEIQYTQIVDSLKSDLTHYKAKENYFAVALEDQSNRFALIITGLLALLALLSYGGYKFELSRMKKDVEKQLANQMQEFEDYKIKIKALDSSLNTSAANTFVTVANNYAKEEIWNLAFEFYLCAARDHASSALLQMELDSNEDEITKEVRYQFVLGSLQPATEMLNKIKANDSFKEVIKNKIDFIILQLDFLASIDYEEAKDLVAEIRIGIKNYVK